MLGAWTEDDIEKLDELRWDGLAAREAEDLREQEARSAAATALLEMVTPGAEKTLRAHFGFPANRQLDDVEAAPDCQAVIEALRAKAERMMADPSD